MNKDFVIQDLGSAAAQLAKAPRALNAALRRAARLWGTQTLKLAKAKAPSLRTWKLVDGKKYPVAGASQALRKSLGAKVTTNKKTGVVSAVIGARSKMSMNVTTPSGKTIVVKASRYIHLVEKGFLAKLWKSKKRVWVPGKPFLGPAQASNQGNAESITANCVGEALLKIQSSGGI